MGKERYLKWLSSYNVNDRRDYTTSKQAVKKAANEVKNQKWEETCREIRTNVGNTCANRGWTLLKSLEPKTVFSKAI